MTTTAYDDRFSAKPEPVHQPYDVVAILRKNIADLELELQRQKERAEKAGAKFVGSCEDLQSWIESRNGWMDRARAAEMELKAAREQKPVAWMHDKDGRVDTCHDSVKKLWLKVGKSHNTQFMREIAPCRVEHYTIPLYAAPVPAPAVPAPSVPEEWLKCWLIERPASSEWPTIWLTITTDGRRWVSDGGTMYSTGGDWYFTTAASEALKFADKESADEYVRHNKIKDVVVTEHIFYARALLQSAPTGEQK